MALPFIRFSPITPYAIRFFSSRSFRQLVAPCHVVVVWTMTNIPLPLSYLFHFFGARAPRSFGECDMGKESWKNRYEIFLFSLDGLKVKPFPLPSRDAGHRGSRSTLSGKLNVTLLNRNLMNGKYMDRDEKRCERLRSYVHACRRPFPSPPAARYTFFIDPSAE